MSVVQIFKIPQNSKTSTKVVKHSYSIRILVWSIYLMSLYSEKHKLYENGSMAYIDIYICRITYVTNSHAVILLDSCTKVSDALNVCATSFFHVDVICLLIKQLNRTA